MERSSSSSSPHVHFFTSLKRLEKRLKLEVPSSPTAAPPPSLPDNDKSTEEMDSLGTPIYLNCNHSIATAANALNLQESVVPHEFLTGSPDFPATHQSLAHEDQTQGEKTADGVESIDLANNIELLMQFLCLSDSEEHQLCNTNMGSDDAFYGKIVGMKGPKSVKEAERLEGWIKYFIKAKGEKKEPYTLALLLLGKSALVNSENACMVFPSSIDEILQTDPPAD